MFKNLKKFLKNLLKFQKILEKSQNLEIEYLTRYNSFSLSFSPLDQEFNSPSFDPKISKIMRKNFSLTKN